MRKQRRSFAQPLGGKLIECEPTRRALEKSSLYSEELGLDLSRGKDPTYFRWFLASILFGARISETTAKSTYRTFVRHGLTTPAKIVAAGWSYLVDPIMREGGYVRYDGRKSTQVLRDCETLIAVPDFAVTTPRLSRLGTATGPCLSYRSLGLGTPRCAGHRRPGGPSIQPEPPAFERIAFMICSRRRRSSSASIGLIATSKGCSTGARACTSSGDRGAGAEQAVDLALVEPAARKYLQKGQTGLVEHPTGFDR